MYEFFGFLLRMLQPVWDALGPIFEWHYHTALGDTISGTIWMFPLIETIHILAMCIMFGSLLVLNMRLMGLGMSKQALPMMAKTLMPFANWGVAIMLLSGYAMFTSEAQKCQVNDGFKIKMLFLATILVFQYTIYRSMLKKDDAHRNTAFSIIVALLNFGLWFMVGAGGRAIGFV